MFVRDGQRCGHVGRFRFAAVAAFPEVGLIGDEVGQGGQGGELGIVVGAFGGVVVVDGVDDGRGQVPVVGEQGAGVGVRKAERLGLGVSDEAALLAGLVGGFAEFTGIEGVEHDLADVVQ